MSERIKVKQRLSWGSWVLTGGGFLRLYRADSAVPALPWGGSGAGMETGVKEPPELRTFFTRLN
jgi:hypothetical protein